MMKNLILLVIGCWLLVLGTEAAPPLRSLKPMTLADGTVIMPPDVQMAPSAGQGCCMSPAMIGSGYLQHTGKPRVLTILAAFEDMPFTVNDPVRAFDQYLNGDEQQDLGNKNNLNASSVRQYFEICSHQKFSPQFDVVGPVTLPRKLAYYGGTNDKGTDERFSTFCEDALEQAKGIVSNWSPYDNDGDGNIELICVIFAGFGQNQGGPDTTLWAKASHLNIRLNSSLNVSRFNCNSELFHPQYPQYINGMGVFIHEFSHCMGLPDLYMTKSGGYVNNQGMESYSIMDYGLYNYNGYAPCPYTAWEQETMGWTEIAEVRPTADSLRQIAGLLPLTEGGKAYKIVNSHNDRDYIVMENVQQRGINKHGEGHGLLVYHVDYPYSRVNMTDSPNNNPGHPSVAVVPAGGTLINSYLRGDNKPYTTAQWRESMKSCVFPGTKNVTSLTSQMALPNYCFWNGSKAEETGIMLSGITEDQESGTVSFTIATDGQTGIAEVRQLMEDGNQVFYDLQGRKVTRPTCGIYIVNGRKVVIR